MTLNKTRKEREGEKETGEGRNIASACYSTS